MLQLIRELAEQVTVNDLVLDGFLLFMFADLLLVGLVVDGDGSFDFVGFFLGDVRVLGQLVLFKEVLPQLLPDDGDGGVDQDGTV